MRRYLLIALLSLGVVGGYGSGIARMAGYGGCGEGSCETGRDRFEKHVARLCVDAARAAERADSARAAATAARTAPAAAILVAAPPAAPAAAPAPATDDGCPYAKKWAAAAAAPSAAEADSASATAPPTE
jgi:hypothetical protein